MSVLLRLEGLCTLTIITEEELKRFVEICARLRNAHILSNLCKSASMNIAVQLPRIRASHFSTSALRKNVIISPILHFWYVEAFTRVRFSIIITRQNTFPCRESFVNISSYCYEVIELFTGNCIRLSKASKYSRIGSTVPNLLQFPVEEKMESSCFRPKIEAHCA